jgi:hypothetical protein
MNAFQFNLYLGLLSLIGGFVLPLDLFLTLPGWLIVLILISLYIGEFWAFLYKLKTARLKYLFELSGGDPDKQVGPRLDPGCMMFYAFLMRFVFRVAVVMVAYIFVVGEPEGELSGWAIGFMITVVLFELFNMLYSLYETRIFSTQTDDSDEEDLKEEWKNDLDWRKRLFPLLAKQNESVKLMFAHFILFFSGAAVSALFWDGMNKEFIGFIKRSAIEHESPWFVIIFTVLACAVLCLFFLMPVKLAFWIERLMQADAPQEKRNYRWSVVFAGMTVTAPTLIQLIKTYLLGF